MNISFRRPAIQIEAVGVAPGEVAGAQPAVVGEGGAGRLLVAPIAGRDAGAGEVQVADLAVGQRRGRRRRRCGRCTAVAACRPSRSASQASAGSTRKAVGPVSVMPMPLQTRTPSVAVAHGQRVGQRRAAAAPVADAAERRGGEARMIEQALIDGRHGEEGVEPPRLDQADQRSRRRSRPSRSPGRRRSGSAARAG